MKSTNNPRHGKLDLLKINFPIITFVFVIIPSRAHYLTKVMHTLKLFFIQGKNILQGYFTVIG